MTGLLLRCFSRLPLWLLHLLGAGMGWLTYAASPTYRRRLRANAGLAGCTPRQVHGAVAHAGRMVAELPRLWFGAPLPVSLANEGCIAEAYAAGRGIVFLTPHMGCFEISAQAVAARFSGRYGPLTVLYRPARQRWLARMLAGARSRPGLDTAPTTLAGVRQMIKALRQNHAVGLLPDQVPPQGMGQWAPFFGRDAYTMTLAARLALQTGATVVLIRCERLPRGKGFVVHAEPLSAPLPATLEDAVVHINHEMERLVLRCPEQYLWGYGRYKQPRAELHGKAGPEGAP
jgi:Kdo2-lipid IVA lauroyltransferase/acyltransferase